MTKKSGLEYRHWAQVKPKSKDFPFSYELESIKNEDVPYQSTITYNSGDNLKEKIYDLLIKVFPYFSLLDEDNYDEKNLFSYRYAIKIVSPEFPDNTSYMVVAKNFKSDYRFTLIKSIEHLEAVLADFKILSFDTETTGLNPEEDKIVGISFAKEKKRGYYIPINHDKSFSEFNLGESAVKLFYEKMVKAEVVYMFNSRFDMRMIEFNYDLDMSKVKAMDAQINAYFADPGYPDHSLKHLEKIFLGYYRPDLSDTLKTSGISTYNTSLIHPYNILFYAAQDSISTLELGLETDKYYREFGISGQVDQMIIYRLMDMENTKLRIDMDYLERELSEIMPRLKELDDKIKAEIGDVNLNSPSQKIKLFESFGIDTGKKTKTGNMATGKEHVEVLIKKFEEQGKKYPTWLGLLNERAKLEKLQSAFFNSLLIQAKMNDGRIRINYRHGNTSTGRFSSGEERES